MHKHASANRFYRLVWSTVHRCWVAVAEGTRSHGKGGARRRAAAVLAGSLAMAGAASASAPVNALPAGMQLVAGQAGVNVQGSSMTVNQATQQAIMNWQGFNIGADAQVRFNQPNASAVALNRVVGGEASAIFGKLSSNGKVFLVNPQGVLFGASAQVNVGGLVASSLGISDQSFLSGSYRFSGSGSNAGAVRNEGRINAAGGVVALLAPAVSNSGSIAAQGGSVVLAAGNAVGMDFRGDGLITLRVEQGAFDALAENKGLLQADNGQVLLTAKAADALARSTVNNAGVVQARGLVADGGTIRLVGDGLVQAGQLDASSGTGQGGSVKIAGGFVALDGAVRADGVRGGSVDVAAAGDLSAASALSAAGTAGKGGSISLTSGASLAENASASSNVSGTTDGGALSLQAGGSLLSSGRHDAHGVAGIGGRVDISGADVRLMGANVDATGATQGGLVRVGGAFQGGAQRADAPDADRFTARWGATASIANADATFINDGTRLDVSARGAAGQGGTAVVWSQQQTTMLGAIKATGAARGGAVEISSHQDLRHVGLERLDIGAGGRLLLDPKNIVIGSFTNQWTYDAVIGKGYSGGKNRNVASLKEGDWFGYSVALTSDGRGLAVGAPLDDGAAGIADANYGAVRLFTFSDGQFNGGTLVGTIGHGYTGGNNYNMSAQLTGGDAFGSSVALSRSGDVLAVGALGSDYAGKVYTFGFGAGFTAPALTQTIASSAGGSNGFGVAVALNGDGDKLAVGALFDSSVELFTKSSGSFSSVSTLTGAADTQFGSAVALNDAGTQLAVGAPAENNGKGMVHLYSTPFTSLTDQGSIGQGGSKLSITLNDGELFGSSLAMNDAGTRLAIGSPTNGGLGSTGTGPGAVRIIDYTGTFSSPAVTAVIGRDYTQGANASLDINDFGNFGFAVAVNGAGDSLVVAQPFADSADGSVLQTGSVNLFRLLPAPAAASIAFGQAYPQPNVNASVDAQKLAAALAAGTSITLQANNDITWLAGNAINAAGTGDLSLQAGRSVELNSNITMGGKLNVTANAGTGAGVVSAYRSAGNAVITVANGTAINAGNVNLTIDTGAGQAESASGDITIAGIVNAKTITVVNKGPSAGSDVVINTGGRLVGSGGGGAATVVVAATGAAGGTFTNNVGSNALQGGANGYYHVYADAPANVLEGMSGYNKHYSQSYTGMAPSYTAAGGNWFMYKLSPTLTVTAQNASKVYDGTDSLPSFSYNVTGYIDGDSGGISGSAAATDFIKNVGTYSLNQGSLLSDLGYNISFASGKTLTVTPKALTVTATGINKVYDGLASAGVTLGDDRVNGDQLTASATSSTFANKDAGNGKAVNVSGIALSGTDAANYSLVSTTAATTANISQRTLNVNATASNKVYDGSINASAVLGDDRVAGDILTVNQAGATFAGKDVGLSKAVQVTGLSLSGTDAANYVLGASTATAAADITQRLLTVGVNASDKVYDGALAATVGYTDNRVNGDALTISGNAAFADKNVGAAKSVTATGLALSGTDAGNYALASPTAGTTASITARMLTVTASGNNKVYDRSQAATVNLSDDRVAGDVLSVGGNAAFTDKNAGTAKDVNVTGIAITGTDSGNYVLSSTQAATKADIGKRTLTVTMNGGNKTYDGTTAATVGLASDALGGDSLSLGSASASFTSKNAGTGKTVNVSGVSIVGGADAGNYVLASSAVSGTADIAARTLVVTATGGNRVYDGSLAAGVTLGDDRVNGDVLSVGGNAAFLDKNVGTAKDISVTGVSLSGTDAGNYVLSAGPVTAKADISARTLNATATGSSKVYDRGTTASVTLGDDRVAGDVLSLSYGAANFTNKNAGNGKTINVSGISATGTDSGNYVLASTNATASGNITPRTLVVAAQASDKVYDGSLAAIASYTDDRLAGDQLSVSGNASFADKNVGNGKAVMASGLSLSGTDAGNYALASGSAVTTADITPRTLNVSVQGNKVYDGGTAVSASFNDDRVAGDVLSVGGSGNFNNKNAGNGKTLTVTGLALSGGDAGNYQLSSTTAVGSGSIAARTLTATVAAADKVYDGTTSTSVVLLGDDRVAGDQLVLTGGNGSFFDKNAGNNKAVSLSGLNVGGADAGNYDVSFVANSTASITQRSLQVSVSGVDKVYDGSLAAGVAYGDNRLAGDQLQVSGNAGFANKNVGNGKAVSVSGISLSGADAGNYAVGNSTANTTASITPRALAAVANGVVNKVYDGSTSAQVTAGQVGLTGFVAGEGASVGPLQGLYNSANVVDAVGVKATLDVAAVNADGGTALSNYVLPADVALAGSISARQLTIGGVSVANKTYDGSANGSLSNIGSLSGLVNGESLVLQGPASVQFDNRNAGTGKQVVASGYGLADGSGRASNYALAGNSVTASGTIDQAKLQVKADDQARAYGAGNPALTWTASGFVGGDTSALLGDVHATTIAARDSAPGSYAIVVGGGSLANYAVDYVNGVMTVARPLQQFDNVIGSAVNPALPGQQGAMGRDLNVWMQLAGDGGPLVDVPADVAAVNGAASPATLNGWGWLTDLVQRAKAPTASDAAVAAPQQRVGETREYTIGGGSRVKVRDGGVNGAVAPN
ncbi:filamentous hemagglutinin family N-terminal domain-containing protein [Duganella sp. CF458]|uniref:YDG domain-containing protein n=2 Tax=Pseudomonadota TaxID=1224 RepID=UPI0008EC306A|nr:YDG domain-containing protein [Duganella sp. CF458]SFG45327.1 filamentous hemagglutinin family N-terminal domain-containing protein [Duganella sp. CF458]